MNRSSFSIKKVVKSPLVIALLIGHLTFGSVLGLRAIGVLQPLELFIYDLMLWGRTKQAVQDQKITMIWFTDEDQRTLGYPLPDQDLAELLENILAKKPIVVGLDIYRDAPVPRKGGEGYDHLIQVIKNHPNVIGIKKFADSRGNHISALPVFEETQQVSFNDLPMDAGGIIRRGLLYLADEDGNVYEALSLKMALQYLASQKIVPQAVPDDPSAIKLGKVIMVPLDPDYGGYVKGDSGGFQIMLDYTGASGEFSNITVVDVLNKQYDPSLLKDKIVIIGVYAEATPDFFYTPFGRWLPGDQRLPGAAVHAFVTSQLINAALGDFKPLQSWNETQEILWIWLWCLSGTLIGLLLHSITHFVLFNVGGVLLLTFAGQLAFNHSLWILMAAPAVGWIASIVVMTGYLVYQERNQRATLMHLFSKHVSKEVAKVIWQEREQYLSGGRLKSQRLTATVLFTDLQSFTTISESVEPQILVDWLNQYMEAMVKVIEQHQGQVNKFIGDSIMALFGVPIQRNTPEEVQQDAINAVQCALSMRQELIQLHEVWESQELPIARMRVGIFTGPLIAGSLGSSERQEYTVLGDTVNIASRLESFDKTVDADNPCRILIGETTLQCIGERFQVECVGETYLKGKHSQVTIYQVIGPQNVIS
ncbi:MAG: hypothetical protein BWK79_09100 [Beggiatoa sp. IS2]|nr:MAG: hypothetical protein BWK79_09100 [Beggiatoa sp. IS2]